jgi:hypothetical protein
VRLSVPDAVDPAKQAPVGLCGPPTAGCFFPEGCQAPSITSIYPVTHLGIVTQLEGQQMWAVV